MNTKIVAALALVLTLLIGVFLGLLGSRIYTAPDRAFRDRPPGRFMDEDFIARRLERAIDPTEAQRDTVRKILEAHAGRLLERHRRQFEETDLLMDSLLLELQGVLTSEQLDRFKAHVDERRPGGPGGRRRGAPGPP
jgi:hypothetical protein